MKLTSIIISVLCFTLALQPNAPKGRYAIFKFSGDVAVQKDRSKGWTDVAKRMSVNPEDMCRIPKGGSVSILDRKTNRIFTVEEDGVLNVKSLIEKAETASRKITARLNDALASDLAMERRAVPTYSILGATTHAGGNGDSAQAGIPTLTDTVCHVLRQYIDSLSTGHEIHPSDGLMVGKESLGDGEFCFVISNATKDLYYFNILRLNRRTKDVSFCITPVDAAGEIFIPDGMYLKLTQYPFAEEDDDEYSYLFFATAKMIDFNALSKMLSDSRQVSGMNLDDNGCLKVVPVM